jgi:Phosphotransferase enzyme family
MIGAVRDRINAISASRGLPRVTGGIVIAVDYAPAAKATLLLFGADGRPCLVAKLARCPETEPVLVAEHTALLDVWSTRPASITAEMPRPIALECVAGRLVLLSTALPGTPLRTRYYSPGHVRHPGRVAADLAVAGSWLARFQEETRSETITLGPETFDEWIRPTFDRYRAEVGWSGWESGLLDHLSDLCAQLSGTRVPVVAVHGDYAPGNILLDSERVSGVVDWELGRGAGLPFSDLFKFAASYGSYLDRACPPARGVLAGHPGWSQARDRWGSTPGWTNGTGILYAFFGSGWFPELVRSYLSEHLRRLGVPPAATQLFLPVFLAEQVLALQQPAYRNGYRALLRLLWEEGASGRLRSMEEVG